VLTTLHTALLIAVAAPASAHTPGLTWQFRQGGTFAEVSFFETILEAPRFDKYYYAHQYSFVGRDRIGYIGLQPTSDLNGARRLRAIFSVFGEGASTSDPNCHQGADGGSGVSCNVVKLPYELNQKIQLSVRQVAPRTWEGTATNLVTGRSDHIGRWTIVQDGLIRPSQSAWIESYKLNGSCTRDTQPPTRVLFGLPTANDGQIVGSMSSTARNSSPEGPNRAPCTHTYQAIPGEGTIVREGY
jgi:hypothetical protein